MDRKLNFQEYVRLYGYMNQNLRGPKVIQIAEYAFQQGDVDNDGLINFDQFLITYALTKSYGVCNNNTELSNQHMNRQGYSNIINFENSSSRRFINRQDLALEYNNHANSKLTSPMTQSYHSDQKQYLSSVINSNSDKNLYVKNY